MKKRSQHFLHLLASACCLAILLFISVKGTAQPEGWPHQTIAPGLEWYRCPDTLFGAKQWVNVLMIDQRQFGITLVSDSNSLVPVSRLAEEAKALAAVNGNFFHTLEGGSVCFTKVNGRVTDTTRYNLPPRWFIDQLDDAALLTDGKKWSIRPTPPGGWAASPYPTIISAGPPLILNDSLTELPDLTFNTKRFGRTAIGITGSGLMVWLTVSGREPDSKGFTMKELQTAMRLFGCTDAINFDGGSSATLWIRGEGRNGVVSVPAWEEATERKVANALVIVPVQ